MAMFFSLAIDQSGVQRIIGAQLSMHNFISMRSFYISATLFILCLYYWLVSGTLVRVTDQFFYVYCKASLNIKTFLSFFDISSMGTKCFVLGSMCACLKEQYLVFFNTC